MIADIYSNKFLAYRIDKSESATAVRLAFYDLFRDWGIPDWALLDNGRAFASKQITGRQYRRETHAAL
ncbi:transposase domain-containing protein [Abyssibius alkaniclasticus]|uniref:transposase domain-containing protein n=1 Tax=Abyssibius alkaniclasticus TaxID=2881234 RepID=UPI00405A3410